MPLTEQLKNTVFNIDIYWKVDEESDSGEKRKDIYLDGEEVGTIWDSQVIFFSEGKLPDRRDSYYLDSSTRAEKYRVDTIEEFIENWVSKIPVRFQRFQENLPVIEYTVCPFLNLKAGEWFIWKTQNGTLDFEDFKLKAQGPKYIFFSGQSFTLGEAMRQNLVFNLGKLTEFPQRFRIKAKIEYLKNFELLDKVQVITGRYCWEEVTIVNLETQENSILCLTEGELIYVDLNEEVRFVERVGTKKRKRKFCEKHGLSKHQPIHKNFPF